MEISDSFTMATKRHLVTRPFCDIDANSAKYRGFFSGSLFHLLYRIPFFSVVNIVMNKNFPAGLSIFHSSYPSTFQSTLDPSDPHVEELSGVLSAEAQDKAIAKFGIAGRVW